ncbi:MAG: CapA family protein [Paludibacteraceae bacterium]|nr:CapA family protein [Paludibacteraceae bacterium]
MAGDIKIAFVGDVTPGGVFYRTGGISQEVLGYLHSFDIRVGTLESAFGDGSQLCHIKMADPKLATCIYSPDEMVKMLKEMRLDAVSLANNHSCDCDLDGLYHTMEVLDKAGIAHFGAGHNSEEASTPAILHHQGKSICLLGYLQEYEYLYRGEGYHPTENRGGLNIYSLKKAITDIKKYKKLYDYVIVMPHWGMEQSAIPLYQEALDAKRMIEEGADGVIGSHAHIVQPAIDYKGHVLAMNLGNFAFPDRYVIPPRISYYPSEEELGQDVPVIHSFKLVDKLSLKVVAEKERLGAILGLELRATSSLHELRYTQLTAANEIVFVAPSVSYIWKMSMLGSLVGGHLSILLWILNLKARMPYIIVGVLKKMRRIIGKK